MDEYVETWTLDKSTTLVRNEFGNFALLWQGVLTPFVPDLCLLLEDSELEGARKIVDTTKATHMELLTRAILLPV